MGKRNRIEYCPGCLIAQPELAGYNCGSQRCPKWGLITPENLLLKRKQREEEKQIIESASCAQSIRNGPKDEQLLFCASCHELLPKSKLIWGPDPYQSEINSDNRKVFLCKDCHKSSSDDI